MKPRSKAAQEKLFLLCREGLAKDAMNEFHDYVQIVNRYVVGAILQSEPAVALVRRELRRLSPGLKISTEDIEAMLPGVLKREVLEGDSAKVAMRRVRRAAKKPTVKKPRSTVSDNPDPHEDDARQ